MYHIVEETFPRLLSIFSKLVQIVNPPIEVADLIKLICKIFWSSIYVRSALYNQNFYDLLFCIMFLDISNWLPHLLFACAVGDTEATI